MSYTGQINRLRRDLAEAEGALECAMTNSWQPIETAPMIVGSGQILLYRANNPSEAAKYACCYFISALGWVVAELGGTWHENQFVVVKDATHWMPLPSSPTD